jgi:hypothetical protein
MEQWFPISRRRVYRKHMRANTPAQKVYLMSILPSSHLLVNYSYLLPSVSILALH